MTGLIRKDMYCLRKNIMEFLLVTTGVIVLAILFIVSTKHGNMVKAIEEMKLESSMGEENFYSFLKTAVWLVLLIPVCFVGGIVECFKEDRKAGFFKYMVSLPLSDGAMVGSRYLSCLLFAMVSMVSSLLAGFFVSLAADLYEFLELAGYVLMFSSLLLIYMSFVLFMLYTFGVEKADLIQCAPFVVIFVSVIVIVQKKLSAIPESEVDGYMTWATTAISDFMKEKWGIFLLIGLFCMALSFLGSLRMIKRRKGNL